MKRIITLLFIGISFLNAQEVDRMEETCIQLDDFCYAVKYRPRDEKVGEICSVKELMINGNTDIVSYSAFISDNGLLFQVTKTTNEKEFLVRFKNLVERVRKENCSIIIQLEIKQDEKIFPFTVSLSKCKN